jgi:hypothetical protein
MRLGGLPGAPRSLYTWRDAQWLHRCRRDAGAILNGIRPFLTRADPRTTTRFTYGTGTTGLESEAYCAGWILVGDLLERGSAFAQLARIPEDHMAAFVKANLGRR